MKAHGESESNTHIHCFCEFSSTDWMTVREHECPDNHPGESYRAVGTDSPDPPGGLDPTDWQPGGEHRG